MEPKKRWILLVIAAFVIGNIVGGYIVFNWSSNFWSGFYGDTNMTAHSVYLKRKLATLEFLEQGKIERASQIVESDMLSDLIPLTMSDHSHLPEKTRRGIFEAVDKARGHYAKYRMVNTDSEFEKLFRQALYDNTYLRVSSGK